MGRARLCRTSTCACAAEPTRIPPIRQADSGVVHTVLPGRISGARKDLLFQAWQIAPCANDEVDISAQIAQFLGTCGEKLAQVGRVRRFARRSSRRLLGTRGGCKQDRAGRSAPVIEAHLTRNAGESLASRFACRGRSAIAWEASAREGTHKLQASERLWCDLANRPPIHALIHSIRTRIEMLLAGSARRADSKSASQTVTRW